MNFPKIYLILSLSLVISGCKDRPLSDSKTIETFLNENGYEYSIDSEGDYKVRIVLSDNQTTPVWIRKDLNFTGDQAVREIFSVGAYLSEEESEYLAGYLLQDNFHTRVMGSWAYISNPEKQQILVMYLLKLPQDVGPSFLNEALREAAFAANVMESVVHRED